MEQQNNTHVCVCILGFNPAISELDDALPVSEDDRVLGPFDSVLI